MKEEYKEEFKKILDLLYSEDDETIILGLSMFKESKWVTDIKKLPNFNDLHIVDVEDGSYECWEDLDLFLEDNIEGDITSYFGDRADCISGLIEGLLRNITKIVAVNTIDNFS